MRNSTISLAGFACLLASPAARAETRSVPDGYATIQAAIDAASEGDTVYVRAGVYVENVILNKSGVLLVGEDGATLHDTRQGVGLPPSLRLGSMAMGGRYYPKPDVIIRRSEVRNLKIVSESSNAMGIFGTQDCRVSGVTIETKRPGNTGIGLHSWNDGIEIDHCTITRGIGTGTGVNGIGASPYGLDTPDPAQRGLNRNVSIHHNEVTGYIHGILIQNSEEVFIHHNTSLGNGYGIRVRGVAGGVIHENTCDESTQYGISIENGLDLLIHHNTSLESEVGFAILPDITSADLDRFVRLIPLYYPTTVGNTIMHNAFCESLEGDMQVPSNEYEDNHFAKNDCPP
jgi:parallel beta-helix repeat protein